MGCISLTGCQRREIMRALFCTLLTYEQLISANPFMRTGTVMHHLSFLPTYSSLQNQEKGA
jgi:hypothetical protein